MALVFGLVSDRSVEEPDPDSTNVVRFELEMRSKGKKVIHSWSAKRLTRLGDAASVALIQILDNDDFNNREIVQDFLPIIRDSFSVPSAVAREIDRNPMVTLFLLNYLKRNTTDTEALAEIERTIRFVKVAK